MRQFKSRKTRKKAIHLKQTGHEGLLDTTPFFGHVFSQLKIVERLKKVFGASKHRGARVDRFKARQRRRR